MTPGLRSSSRSGAARPTTSPARQASLREHNLALVLTRICAAPTGQSRAHLARDTGLTRATVSELVDLLLQAGLVRELMPRAQPGAGRPAIPVIPAEHGILGLGVDIAVDHVAVCTVNLAGAVVSQRVIEGDFAGSDPDKVIAKAARLIQPTMADAAAMGARVAGACMALPGLVEPQTARLRHAPNLEWTDIPVADLLRESLDMPSLQVSVGNDASLAATAEVLLRSRRSDLRPCSDFLYITGEVGIGGALVRHGVLAEGSRGWAGEIGHTTIDRDGPRCPCGASGCLERYAGKTAVLARAGLPAQASWDQLQRQLASGDPTAQSALVDVARALGVASASALNILDMDTVILGGAYAPLADLLRPPMLAELLDRVIAVRFVGTEVFVEAALGGEHAALHGAGLSVVNAVLAHPADWLELAG